MAAAAGARASWRCSLKLPTSSLPSGLGGSGASPIASSSRCRLGQFAPARQHLAQLETSRCYSDGTQKRKSSGERRQSSVGSAESNTTPTEAGVALYQHLLTEFEVGEQGLLTRRNVSSSENPTFADAEELLARVTKLMPNMPRSRAQYEAARQQWQRERGAKAFSRSFSRLQLVAMCKEVAVPGATTASTKAKLIEAIIQKLQGMDSSLKIDPSGTAAQRTEPLHTEKHALTRSQMFILMARNRQELSKLGTATSTHLTASVQRSEEGGKAYILNVTGPKHAIGTTFKASLDSFVQSIRSDTVSLQVPLEVLDGHAIAQLCSATGCSIEPYTGRILADAKEYTILSLSAASDDSLARAKLHLYAMQAELYQSHQRLFTLASPAAARTFADHGIDSAYRFDAPAIKYFNFVPQPRPSPLGRLQKYSLPSRLQLFRLGAAKTARGGIPAELSQFSSTELVLAEVEHPNAAPGSNSQEEEVADIADAAPTSGSNDGWSRLEEFLVLDEEELVSRASITGQSKRAEMSHSLKLGTLSFRSMVLQEVDDEPTNALADVLAPPIVGSWSLERVQRWLRGADDQESSDTAFEEEQTAFGKRPIWTDAAVTGIALDRNDVFSSSLQPLLASTEGGRPSAQEAEWLRYTYRVEQATDESVEPVARLCVNVRESCEVLEGVEEVKGVEDSDSDNIDAFFTPASAKSRVVQTRKYNYEVESAAWATDRSAQILIPEQAKDAQLTVTAKIAVTGDKFDKLRSSMADYLTELSQHSTRSVASPGQLGSASNTAAQPIRLAELPAPLVDAESSRPIPPTKLRVGSRRLILEAAERVGETSWPLRVAEQRPNEAEARSAEAELFSDAQRNDFIGDGDEVSSTTGSLNRQPRLVVSTVVSNETRGARTSTRIDWPDVTSANSTDEGKGQGSGWAERLRQVMPIIQADRTGQRLSDA